MLAVEALQPLFTRLTSLHLFADYDPQAFSKMELTQLRSLSMHVFPSIGIPHFLIECASRLTFLRIPALQLSKVEYIPQNIMSRATDLLVEFLPSDETEWLLPLNLQLAELLMNETSVFYDAVAQCKQWPRLRKVRCFSLSFSLKHAF